jgi:hypothetical protein
MAYPNWKLGEKKAIKEALEDYESAVGTIKEKLGSHWEVDIDWGVFGELIDANSSYRSDPGKTVIRELVVKFVENDLQKMQDDSVAALNGIVGTPAKLLFTMGKKTEKYELNSRCSIKIAKGQATLKWSNDWTGYSWGDSYLERTVIHLPNVAVKPDYPGGWNISQLRSITEVKDEIESAESEIKSKLGADWKLNIAWESFAKNIPESSSYRENIGKTVVQALVTKWVANDLGKMDDDVTSAANELAGSKHVVTFRMGPKTGTYKINSRVNVSVDDSNGIVFEWSGDWSGYECGSDYVNAWVLSNA